MRSMTTRILGTLTATFLLASTAYAVPEMEVDKTVRQVSVNSTLASIVVQRTGASRNCALSLMLFDPTTAIGRVWYDTLLEALSTGAQVDIAYERNGNRCDITQINIR